ncbi:MAG TPA: hypothetical protein VF041_07155 [Gemmatimonadaceae bacterium]
MLVTTPLSAAWIAAHDDAGSVLHACRDFAPASGAGALGAPWHAFDEAAGDAPLIMIQIMPAMRWSRPSCEGSGPPSAALAARGVAIEDRPPIPEYGYPRGALVRIGGHVVRPVLYGRVPVERLAHRSRSSRRATDDTIPQLRLYIPAAALALDSAGHLPRVVVRVWGRDTSHAVDIDLPPSVVRQVWDDLLPWRLEIASTSTSTSTAIAALLPTPSDSALRDARQRYRDGDWKDAALLTHERFYVGPLTRDDSLEGHVQLALALLSMGDTADVDPVIQDVMRDNPCLTLAPGAPPELARRVDRARPRARCDVAVGRTILRGLLLPGYGQISTGRSLGPVISAGAAIALTVAAIRYASSQSDYHAYQRNPNTQAAVAMYDEASHKRRQARGAALTGLAFWVLGALEAGIQEMQHGAAVRRVRGYGVTPLARSDARRADIGLALSF